MSNASAETAPPPSRDLVERQREVIRRLIAGRAEPTEDGYYLVMDGEVVYRVYRLGDKVRIESQEKTAHEPAPAERNEK